MTDGETLRKALAIFKSSRAPYEEIEIINEKNEPERTKQLEQLLQDYVQHGWLEEALETAGLIGRRLKKKELRMIAKKCIDNSWLEDARMAIDKLPEEENDAYLGIII